MNNMKYYRNKRGFTIQELSIRTGIHPNTLVHIEKSEMPSTSVKNIILISKALDVTIENLFFEETVRHCERRMC